MSAGVPRRLAFFIPSLGGGGAERSILKLAGAFAAGYEEIDIDLVVSRRSAAPRYPVPDGVRAVDLDAPSAAGSIPRLTRYLRRVRPDVVMSAMPHANLALLVARKLCGSQTRVVVSERLAFTPFESIATWRGRVTGRLRGVLYPQADAILAVSDGVAADLCAATGIARDAVHVLPNPVVTPDADTLRRQPVQHPWLAHRVPGENDPGEAAVLLAVGRLHPQKGFADLLRALHAVRRHRPTRLIILGEGPQFADLERQVAEQGLDEVVSLPGFVANPHAYMARADLFVLSSHWEGLPGALIEAMAAGCPVVSTDCPSGPAEILAGGRLAPLVAPGDVAGLARAIVQQLADPAPTGPLIARAHDFSVEKSVRAHARVLLTGETWAAAPLG